VSQQREDRKCRHCWGKWLSLREHPKGIGAGIANELAIRGAAVVVNYARDRTGTEAVVAEIAAIDNGAKLNQVVYWSRPVNSKNQTLTPNPDTIYLNPFYDTSNGPVVVSGLTSAPRATLTSRVGSQFFNTSE
jgi:hypothetical protein